MKVAQPVVSEAESGIDRCAETLSERKMLRVSRFDQPAFARTPVSGNNPSANMPVTQSVSEVLH
jgi:hypothetical protein